MAGNRLLCSPCNETSGAHTLCSLGDEELASGLDGLVNVVALVGAVWEIVVGNVVELVLLEELGGDDPRAVLNDLIDPFAVTEGLGALSGGHDGQTLALVRLVVASDADDQSGVGESLLGLFELAHVAVGR